MTIAMLEQAPTILYLLQGIRWCSAPEDPAPRWIHRSPSAPYWLSAAIRFAESEATESLDEGLRHRFIRSIALHPQSSRRSARETDLQVPRLLVGCIARVGDLSPEVVEVRDVCRVLRYCDFIDSSEETILSQLLGEWPARVPRPSDAVIESNLTSIHGLIALVSSILGLSCHSPSVWSHRPVAAAIDSFDTHAPLLTSSPTHLIHWLVDLLRTLACSMVSPYLPDGRMCSDLHRQLVIDRLDAFERRSWRLLCADTGLHSVVRRRYHDHMTAIMRLAMAMVVSPSPAQDRVRTDALTDHSLALEPLFRRAQPEHDPGACSEDLATDTLSSRPCSHPRLMHGLIYDFANVLDINCH